MSFFHTPVIPVMNEISSFPLSSTNINKYLKRFEQIPISILKPTKYTEIFNLCLMHVAKMFSPNRK